MILTKTHANIIWKVLTQKKKHKSVSMTKGQLYSWINMVNVLNTLTKDQTEVADGVLAEKYKYPTFLKDMVLPTTISYSGTRKGTNFKSGLYLIYDPVRAGFCKVEDIEKYDLFVMDSDGEGEATSYLKGLDLIDSTIDIDDNGFCPFLSPQDFEAIGGLFLANVKKDASEDKFTSYEERYESLTNYADKMTTNKNRCKHSVTAYFPVLSNTDFYISTEYRGDVEEMIEDWFRACCDGLLNG